MKNTYCKLLSGILIISLATLAKAEQYNVWNYTFGQGAFDLDIRANENQVLSISCDFNERNSVGYLDYTSAKIPGANSNTFRDYDYSKINNGIPNEVFFKSLSLKMNGKIHPFPMSTKSKTRQQSIAWKSFANDISQANKIEIIKNGKTIVTFFPSFKSMQNIKKIKDC
jgi:hypothetical protein